MCSRMCRVFTVKQCQDKMIYLRGQWALSEPSIPSPTGNPDEDTNESKLPLHYDFMLEYLGGKQGYPRDSLFTTDDGKSDVEVDIEVEGKDDIIAVSSGTLTMSNDDKNGVLSLQLG